MHIAAINYFLKYLRSFKAGFLVILLTTPLFITGNLWSAVSVYSYIDIHKCDKIIYRGIYRVCYSYSHKGPIAVWYALSSWVNSKNIKPREVFHPDLCIPRRYRTTNSNYYKSGFDKGHLANDADFDYKRSVLKLTYFLSNATPQYPEVNRHSWLAAERLERAEALRMPTMVINLIKFKNGNDWIPSEFIKIISNDNSKCFKFANIKKVVSLDAAQIDCDSIKFDK